MKCAMTIPVTRTANKFSALKDDNCNGHGDGDECNDVQLMALNQWAHKVQRVSSKKSQKSVKKPSDADFDAALKHRKKKFHLNVVIKSEADLDAALSQHSQSCAALSGSRGDRKVLEHMLSKSPPAGELKEGECWVMVDSGSGVDGLDASRDAPGVPTRKAEHPIQCVTANGKTMDAEDEVALTVELDGERIDIPFSDLPLTMPILSVRKHVRRNHRCRIKEGGGYFTHNVTSKRTRFVEKEGVYFMRMKVVGLSEQLEADKSMGFVRPVAR